MSNISLVLITKNEQENLKKWKGWIHKITCISEIVVVDDGSTDETKKIVKSFETKAMSVKVFDRKLNNDFAGQRNFALSKTQNDWILVLDADETPSPKLINFLNNFNFDNNYSYSINRYLVYQNHILYHGISATDKPVRLFNKNNGKYKGLVHETFASSVKITNISYPIFHNSASSLSLFLHKINQYSTIRANELFSQNKSVSLIDIFLYPKAKFVQYYFWHLGFLDGVAGLIISLTFSFYSFLVRAKLWRLYHV